MSARLLSVDPRRDDGFLRPPEFTGTEVAMIEGSRRNMNKAIQILTHSVRQVFGNLGPALRLSLLPYALQILILTLIAPMFASPSATGAPDMANAGIGFAQLLLIVLVMAATSMIIAVNWHRFVLNNESPSVIPHLHGREMMSYLGRIIVVSVIAALIVTPVMILINLALVVSDVITPMSVLLIQIAFIFAASILALRLSVSLPAMALGENMSLREGWDSLGGQWPTLISLVILLGGIQIALGWIVSLFAVSPPLMFVAGTMASWITLMIGLSVLTTLYGHYVQGRQLR